ncbi:hypothetical protein KUCAC02_014643 [Chaenocephalus aceratus]|uniref:Uncharacterized protein n=1 Tax=Chaenocephalus aceratus TaxID=36190 RepID=A0ACB9WFF4_CHAAC|nr:hypothetical protein KUCAC02_014643 [Chaenocephalus aceratus]
MARETQRSAVDDYTTYLSIMGSISDHSSDEEEEELNQAIMASLQSHMEIANTKSSQEVLLDLASKIDTNQRCKFNINRSAVLDGKANELGSTQYCFKRRWYFVAGQAVALFIRHQHCIHVSLVGPPQLSLTWRTLLTLTFMKRLKRCQNVLL